MDNSYQTENFLKTIKSMEDTDLMSLKDIDVAAIKRKSNDELVEIYYKQGNYKSDWDILAKNELENRGIDVEQQTGEKQSMFKGCFSFSGRIRRLEYGLSFILYFMYAFVMGLFLRFAFPYSDISDEVIYLLLIPAYWLMLSQGTRRCHDLGHSGWWQLIPFYGIVMLFSEGDLGKNEYGDNPKGKGNF